MNGFVYILINPAFPRFLKIGKTYRSVKERADELSAHSGLPSPFCIRHIETCSDCDSVEYVAHKLLEKHRVNEGREFFEISLTDGIEIVRRANQLVEERLRTTKQ